MATETKTRPDKQSTISFTLPISCQICLGKVKQPVLCPNNHVFCGICMEVWLSRNQQCPACRVNINPGNPIQEIRGGLNHFEDDQERLSNPQMRKARFELLYKEYEEEFERLTADIQILRTENEVLKSQIKKENGYNIQKNAGDFIHPSAVDVGQVLAVTRKLQDTQKQYDRLKQDSKGYKQENNDLKDENVNLNRENERLRVEIANRSPHRFGRYTVATLESKVESFEKEIKQLNKALERSDQYIEDLEKELESYRPRRNNENPKLVKDYIDFNVSVVDTKQEVEASKRRLFSEHGSFSEKSNFDKTDPVQFALDLYKTSTKNITGDNNATTSTKTLQDKRRFVHPQSPNQKQWKSSLSVNSPVKERTPKKVQFDLKKDNDSSSSSFDLERPSPLTPSSSMGKLSLSDNKFTTGNPSSAKKHLNFGQVNTSGNARIVSNNFKHSDNSRIILDKEDGLDDTGAIKSELDELNISLTPELSDCMKLLNRAEKNVHGGKPSTSTSEDRVSSGAATSASILPQSFLPETHASSLHQQIQKIPQVPKEIRPASSLQKPPSPSVSKGDNLSVNSLSFSGTGNSDSFRLDGPTGNYSYVSNDLSSRGSDSYLPEPKKRLFETDDDFDISMSPIKTTRHY